MPIKRVALKPGSGRTVECCRLCFPARGSRRARPSDVGQIFAPAVPSFAYQCVPHTPLYPSISAAQLNVEKEFAS